MTGKIAKVAELISSNPGMEKKDLVALVVKELNVPKQNAYVYIFNANKKLAKGDVPKVAKAPKVTKTSKMAEAIVAKASETAKKNPKAKNLETMKKVTKEQRKQDEALMVAKRGEMVADIDTYLDDADAYISTLTKSARKTFNLSE